MQKFLEGHATFRREFAAGASAFLKQLADHHQSPAALYVGCSDSRVVPELLTSSAPGELFVVRNIANAVPTFAHADASVGAALEYGVEALHVQHIVVCGHYGCGGVKAALDRPALLGKLPSLREWVDNLTGPIAAADLPELDAEERWRHAVEVNVLAQLANLSTYPVLRGPLQAETVHLHGWVYDLATGGVSVYDAVGERWIDAARVLA